MAKEQTKAEMQEELDALKAKLEKAKANTNSGLSMKVSPKGAMSLYGMGRFPVTMYRNQWEKVLNFDEEIKAFLEENKGKLATKG